MSMVMLRIRQQPRSTLTDTHLPYTTRVRSGLASLDILVLWRGFPTYSSTQTIFSILTADFFHLEQNQYVQWSPTAKAEVMVPGQHETAMALPWGGTEIGRAHV